MKYKTAELTGALLDAAVAKATGMPYELMPQKTWGDGFGITIVTPRPACFADGNYFEPSTDWSKGGPLIERERISIRVDTRGGNWVAFFDGARATSRQKGESALIAAMRAYVSHKLGEEVEL